ncbi:hypothetical protein PENSPDRAFT_732331 [Peniophora sp. CONT]|nr:hypothetical protein PENSPDRAFT_732331 [Peniophora sp. CONT]
MTEAPEWATIFFFEEFTDKTQLEVYERFRTAFQKQWGHLFSEHGQWYGREVGKRERLWHVIFWKDEHCDALVRNDPVFQAFEHEFFAKVAPIDNLWSGVPVKGTPLHEVLAASVVFIGYYSLSPSQSPAGFENLTKRLLDQLDYPGWQGMAYVSPVDTQGEALSMGAWDSVEATAQLGMDGRFADILDEANEAFDTAKRTFMALVKFQKHIM